jgi:hypothetical protein
MSEALAIAALVITGVLGWFAFWILERGWKPK